MDDRLGCGLQGVCGGVTYLAQIRHDLLLLVVRQFLELHM